MRKTVAKRILVSLITLVMVSVCVLPMVIKNANVAGAAENVAGSDEEYKDNLTLHLVWHVISAQMLNLRIWVIHTRIQDGILCIIQ